MAERPAVHLIDGSGYIYRAYYAIRPLSTRAGVPTNAVLGFARMLLKLLREEKPSYLGIAFDARQKTFRHETYPDYKANREAPPEDLGPQFPLIHELVDAMDIPRLVLPGFEADDVMATLSRQARAAGHDVVLVSADKDLMQLVGNGVVMFDPMKDRRFDVAAVKEKFGVTPDLIPEVQALAGDASDNIPGVPKVGLKTAAKLVNAYGDIEQVIAGLSELDKLKAAERSVIENAESARLSRKLTGLAYDAPVELDLDTLVYGAPKPEKIGPFLKKIEASALMRELGIDAEAARRLPNPTPAPAPTGDDDASPPVGPPIDRSVYRTVLTLEALEELLEAARVAGRFAFDLETTALDPSRAEIVGVALAVPDRPAAYIPIAHRYIGVPKQLKLSDVLDRLRAPLADPKLQKVGQNLKYDIVCLSRYGIDVQGVRHDSMIAAYVLDPGRPSFGLDALAREFLAHETIKFRDIAGTGRKQLNFEEVMVEDATPYAAEDADVALRLCEILPPKIQSAGQMSLYGELEMPLMPILAEMERVGIRIDTQQLKSIGAEFGERLKKIEETAHALAGERVNLASTKQLGVLFFETLGYPVIKKTKTGYSTDHEVLEELSKDHELPKVVLEHRLLSKLRSTYVDALVKMADDDGRVHTSYNQSGAATGRLSSSDPNLQNIPIRTEDGRRIRAVFVAREGWQLISADYSQVELRIMAHLSGDESFIEAFQRGDDIHARTALEVLTGGEPPDKEARRRAKAINFGILYGLSEFGLSRQLGIPRSEAHAYISRYFARYPAIRAYLDRTIAEAARAGYVSTIAGRRRYLPNLTSKNRNVRQGAERIAMNTPMQGSAADLIKMAMLRVDARLQERRLQAKLLLQVHDELVLEAPGEEVDEIVDLVRQEMSQVYELAVPLLVDVGTGSSWADAH